MASNISQSYPHKQTIFPDDEDGFCQLSAPRSDNVLVPHQIHARGMFDALGGACPSPITTMMFENTGTGTMWADQQQNCFPDHLIDHRRQKLVPLETDSLMIPLPTTYPERLGVSDLVVPDLYSSSSCSFSSGNQLGRHDRCSLYRNDSCDLGMELMDFCETCSDDNRLKPLYHELRDMNWGIRANQVRLMDDDPSTKVGRYTMEEKKNRILRYMKKRNQRNFNKTIKYACRKTLADRRVRVRGRFARNNDSCDNEEIAASMKKIENPQQQQIDNLFFRDDVLIKQDDDDDRWLQEAMASLIYLPNCTNGCS